MFNWTISLGPLPFGEINYEIEEHMCLLKFYRQTWVPKMEALRNMMDYCSLVNDLSLKLSQNSKNLKSRTFGSIKIPQTLSCLFKTGEAENLSLEFSLNYDKRNWFLPRSELEVYGHVQNDCFFTKSIVDNGIVIKPTEFDFQMAIEIQRPRHFLPCFHHLAECEQSFFALNCKSPSCQLVKERLSILLEEKYMP